MTGRVGGALRAAAVALETVIFVAFPLLVFAGVSRLGARTTALALFAVLLPGAVRAAARGRGRLRAGLVLPLSTAVLLALAAALDDGRFMLAYPVLVNGALLLQFGLSLRGRRSLVETFALLQVPDLSEAEQRYCRSVTKVWCAFFVLNGTAAALLALFAPRPWWAAYTGAIAYGLVAVLFAAEYVVRKARFQRFNRGPVDRLLLAPLLRSRVAHDP
jgi:uncharacterized membrane protein